MLPTALRTFVNNYTTGQNCAHRCAVSGQLDGSHPPDHALCPSSPRKHPEGDPCRCVARDPYAVPLSNRENRLLIRDILWADSICLLLAVICHLTDPPILAIYVHMEIISPHICFLYSSRQGDRRAGKWPFSSTALYDTTMQVRSFCRHTVGRGTNPTSSCPYMSVRCNKIYFPWIASCGGWI